MLRKTSRSACEPDRAVTVTHFATALRETRPEETRRRLPEPGTRCSPALRGGARPAPPECSPRSWARSGHQLPCSGHEEGQARRPGQCLLTLHQNWRHRLVLGGSGRRTVLPFGLRLDAHTTMVLWRAQNATQLIECGPPGRLASSHMPLANFHAQMCNEWPTNIFTSRCLCAGSTGYHIRSRSAASPQPVPPRVALPRPLVVWLTCGVLYGRIVLDQQGRPERAGSAGQHVVPGRRRLLPSAGTPEITQDRAR
jgi:hypothetical protein